MVGVVVALSLAGEDDPGMVGVVVALSLAGEDDPGRHPVLEICCCKLAIETNGIWKAETRRHDMWLEKRPIWRKAINSHTSTTYTCSKCNRYITHESVFSATIDVALQNIDCRPRRSQLFLEIGECQRIVSVTR